MANLRRDWKPPLPEKTSTQLAERIRELRSALQCRDPKRVAVRSGASYLTPGAGRGELHLPFFRSVCIFPFPELKGCDNYNHPLPDFEQTLLLYYLVTADGAPLTGRWVSFADLPDGRTYNAAFQGYSGNEIAKTFGLDLDSFKQACISCGGVESSPGDASFIFQALPRVPLRVAYWLGEEEFPSSCKILFDQSASHYLPVDACAILGNMLTRRVISSMSL